MTSTSVSSSHEWWRDVYFNKINTHTSTIKRDEKPTKGNLSQTNDLRLAEIASCNKFESLIISTQPQNTNFAPRLNLKQNTRHISQSRSSHWRIPKQFHINENPPLPLLASPDFSSRADVSNMSRISHIIKFRHCFRAVTAGIPYLTKLRSIPAMNISILRPVLDSRSLFRNFREELSDIFDS